MQILINRGYKIMINWIRKLFCTHDYKLTRVWLDKNKQGLNTGEERVYMCKKCMKIKRIRI